MKDGKQEKEIASVCKKNNIQRNNKQKPTDFKITFFFIHHNIHIYKLY